MSTSINLLQFLSDVFMTTLVFNSVVTDKRLLYLHLILYVLLNSISKSEFYLKQYSRVYFFSFESPSLLGLSTFPVKISPGLVFFYFSYRYIFSRWRFCFKIFRTDFRFARIDTWNDKDSNTAKRGHVIATPSSQRFTESSPTSLSDSGCFLVLKSKKMHRPWVQTPYLKVLDPCVKKKSETNHPSNTLSTASNLWPMKKKFMLRSKDKVIFKNDYLWNHLLKHNLILLNSNPAWLIRLWITMFSLRCDFENEWNRCIVFKVGVCFWFK